MLSMLILAAAIAAPSPSTRPVAARGTFSCRSQVEQVTRNQASVGPRRLDELPNANLYLAVERLDQHGCERPVIVRYDIGSGSRR